MYNISVRSIYERLDLKTLTAVAGICGPAILVACDVSLGLLDSGYSFIHYSISSLAWAKLGWIQTVGFMAIGLLIEFFVVGLWMSIKGVRGFGFGIFLLMLFGFGMLLVGAFHTDPAAGPATFDGTIHGFAAKFVFWFFPVAVLLIAPSLRKEPYWRGLFFYSLASAVFAIGFMANSLRMPHDFDWFGLFERILVADEIIWIWIMAVWLLRLSLKQKKMLRQTGAETL